MPEAALTRPGAGAGSGSPPAMGPGSPPGPAPAAGPGPGLASAPGPGRGRYAELDRDGWAALAAGQPDRVDAAELASLEGIGVRLTLGEVRAVQLPLAVLVERQVAAVRARRAVVAAAAGEDDSALPVVVGIAGGVAVGKSTMSRVLQVLLGRGPDRPHVELVTTDGFLQPNRELERRGLLARKGFPESYDLRALVRFLADVSDGQPEVSAPVYSHEAYDVLPGVVQTVRRPDLLIVEGVNVLQAGAGAARPGRTSRLLVSDFFDTSVYVEAAEADVQRWYVDRFLTLRSTVFQNPASYFHRFAGLDGPGAVQMAESLWADINLVNLRDNIRPTRGRAQVVLTLGADHRVDRVRLRRH